MFVLVRIDFRAILVGAVGQFVGIRSVRITIIFVVAH